MGEVGKIADNIIDRDFSNNFGFYKMDYRCIAVQFFMGERLYFSSARYEYK